jgi:PAS domain S-box-containing protein
MNQIDRCRSRMAQIAEALEPTRGPGEQRHALERAVAEMSVTIEELSVADEELRQQNDQLREAHAQLEFERERYRSLFELAPDPYLVTDINGVIAEANAAAAELFRVPRARLIGKPIAVFAGAESRIAIRGRVLQAADGHRLCGWEFDVLARGSETPIPVEATVQATEENGVRVLRWLLRDVTERQLARAALVAAYEGLEDRVLERTRELYDAKRALEEELRRREELVRQLTESEHTLTERTEELARSNEDLQDFAYVASHDLKEPLRGISNFAQFVLQDHGAAIGPDGRAKLETIARLSGRLHELIESLLEYSRAGRLALKPESTALGRLAREVVDSLGGWLAEHGGRVVIRPLPEIVCDRVRIGEVLSNLIVNAVKYNDGPEKLVEIGCEPAPAAHSGEAGKVRFYVSDNGIGIREQHRETIFKMFRRLHARDRFGGGVGAGLAIVRKIIDRHHGAIWVESLPGQGSRFVFTLPGGWSCLTGAPRPESGANADGEPKPSPQSAAGPSGP